MLKERLVGIFFGFSLPSIIMIEEILCDPVELLMMKPDRIGKLLIFSENKRSFTMAPDIVGIFRELFVPWVMDDFL